MNLEIFKDQADELLDVNKSNQTEVYENFLLTFKIRHNLLHYFIAKKITNNMLFIKERRISEMLTIKEQNEDFDKIKNLTPDIIFGTKLNENGDISEILPLKDENIHEMYKIFLIDISVTSEKNKINNQKIKKYNTIKEFIENNYKIEVVIQNVIFDISLTNIIQEINKLENMLGKELIIDEEIEELLLAYEYIENTRKKLKEFVNDPSLLTKILSKEFGEDLHKDDTKSLLDIKKEIKETTEKYKKDKTNITNNEAFEKMLQPGNSLNDFKNNNFKEKWTKMLKNIIEDEEIYNTYVEKNTESSKVKHAIDYIIERNEIIPKTNPKPTHHIVTPLTDKKTFNNKFIQEHTFKPEILGLRKEQCEIYSILSIFNSLDLDDSRGIFVKEMFEKLDKVLNNKSSATNKNIFNNGIYMSKDMDAHYKEKYHKTFENKKNTKKPSFNEFLRKELLKNEKVENNAEIPQDKEDRAFRQKMLKINISAVSEDFKSWHSISHSSFNKDKRKYIDKEKKTIEISYSDDVEKFLDLLTEQNNGKYLEFDNRMKEYLFVEPEDDLSVLLKMKKECLKEVESIYNIISETKGYEYLHRQSMFAEQLMHFEQFSLPSNTFSFFTAGTKNNLTIINNSYHNKGKDVGKAFMFCGYTDDIRWLSSIIGDVNIYKFNGLYFYITNWRRLENFKVTFLRDQFYSVTSTSIAGISRSVDEFNKSSRLVKGNTKRQTDLIRHHLSLKIMIGLSTNQKTAEMLADMRYAIMAAFAEFSEINKLIVDKFEPPFKTSLECWIFKRCFNLEKQVKEFREDNNIRAYLKRPVYKNNKRSEESIGGKINIPSIWDNVLNKDIQDLLDDLFLYVHTLKEPSSIHHENIKAINNILKYQKMYDSLSSERKKGNVTEFDSIKEFLLDKNQIGHVSEIVESSCKLMLSQLPSEDLNHLFGSVLVEPVSEITSTKASIPEYDRTVVSQEFTKKQTSKQKVFLVKYKEDRENRINILKEKVLIKTNVNKESFLPEANRSKVHDCLLDVLERNTRVETVNDLSLWNINKNNARVVADICIKAQYGAKREFYVINVGAKCNARILENFFNKLSQRINNEMISVPGDKKMLVMQEYVNSQLYNKQYDDLIYFVNGDCTKWSAAETMECFMSLLNGFQDKLDNEFIEYLKTIVNMWANKDITIPVSILQNTFYISEHTELLKNQSYTVRSTQNFLQGMFNYMSSFKAVCSTNLAIHMWKVIYPEKPISVDHLEHSDDYSLIIKVKNKEDLKLFRCLHRVTMKLHGVNDSIKKTNTQEFLMEFISLVSFNGHMTYPHIKKMKECGMNLGCTGFRDDVDMAVSRSSECLRVGVKLPLVYFFQRLHLLNVYKSYSLLPGQSNNMYSVKDMWNLPVEVFGLPDTFPLLNFLTKGLPNNFRLYNYSNRLFKIPKHEDKITAQELIRRLYCMQKEEYNDILDETISEKTELRLFHPTYKFDIENKLIKKIRGKLQTDYEEAKTFWEKHVSYNFVKPKNRHLLVRWMQSMYFKTTFAVAYSRNSRSQITLRLSTFTTQKCCSMKIKNEKKDIRLTEWLELIGEINTVNYMLKFGGDFFKELNMILTNCDNNVNTFYSFLDDCTYHPIQKKDISTVSALTPVGIDWLCVDNSAPELLQFIFNYEDFLKDGRQGKGLIGLNHDKLKIEEVWKDSHLSETKDLSKIKLIFNDILKSKPKRNIIMTYTYNTNLIENFLRKHLEHSLSLRYDIQLTTAGVKETVNPHTGEIVYRKIRMARKENFKVFIDDICLIYTLLVHLYKLPRQTVKDILKSLYFDHKDPLQKMKFEEILNLKETDLQMLNTTEKKILFYIKSYFTGEIQHIYELFKDNLTYLYNYTLTPLHLSSYIKESVNIKYNNNNYIAHLRKDNKLIIVTDSYSKRDYSNVYLIALKLFNLIRLSELEKRINRTSLRMIYAQQNIRDLDLVNIKLAYNLKSVLILDNSNNLEVIDINEINSNETDCVYTILHVNNLPNIENGIKDNLNEKVRVKWEDMTVYSGRQKVFTLPILTCVQSNCTKSDINLNLNGFDLSWWLKSDRIQKLIHGEKLNIDYDDFGKIVDFEVKTDKTMFMIKACKHLDIIKDIPLMEGQFDNDQIIQDLQRKIDNLDINPNTIDTENFEFDEDILKELDAELGDFLDDDVKFEQYEFDEDELELEKQNFIENELSESSVSENLLGVDDFKITVPKILTDDFYYSREESRTSQMLKRIGDPTKFIIENYYVDFYQLHQISEKEIFGLLYRLKEILLNTKYISHIELIFSIVLLNQLNEVISDKDFLVIESDFVFHLKDPRNLFALIRQDIDLETKKRIIEKGGFIDDQKGIFLPLNKTRRDDIIEKSLSIVTVDNFCNIKVLSECYYRLFKVPFKRIGFFNVLLSEL